MATITDREMFLDCEVKRLRIRAGGGYEPFWKVKTVVEALEDNDTEFRCKSCGGAVKVVKRRSEAGPGLHVEHKLRADSEHCRAGLHFLKATDGREPRMSSQPVH